MPTPGSHAFVPGLLPFTLPLLSLRGRPPFGEKNSHNPTFMQDCHRQKNTRNLSLPCVNLKCVPSLGGGLQSLPLSSQTRIEGGALEHPKDVALVPGLGVALRDFTVAPRRTVVNKIPAALGETLCNVIRTLDNTCAMGASDIFEFCVVRGGALCVESEIV